MAGGIIRLIRKRQFSWFSCGIQDSIYPGLHINQLKDCLFNVIYSNKLSEHVSVLLHTF